MTVDSVLTWLIIAALIAVALALLVGIAAMFKGGEFNRKYGNIIMRWRVGLQALAVALLFLLWWVQKG